MNLIIDIGNSKIKLAIFDSSRSIVFENFEIDNLENMIVQTIEKYTKINQTLLLLVNEAAPAAMNTTSTTANPMISSIRHTYQLALL